MALYLDSSLFRNVFSTPEMRAIFDDEHYFETFMAVEAALARAEADAGVIPEWAAEAITEKATIEHLDIDRLETLIGETGHPAMSIIGAWKPAFDDAGEYIHWGATTQDILDTTMVLQAREALEIVRRELLDIRSKLAQIAETHADTPMTGRTHFVHAVPMTFGMKVAVWVDEIDRHLDRLDAAMERSIALQFFGAVGTLASLGEPGREVQANLADELDLQVPAVCWHAARDRPAELVRVLAETAGTIGKIARQVLFLNRPEVGEVTETPADEHIGSSTMPHKINPKKAELTVALSRLIRGQSAVMQEAMGMMDERDATNWYCEFAVIPSSFLYSSRMLANAGRLVETLEIHPERMRENLDIYGALLASERIMMVLAEEIGRQTAHEIVSEAAQRSMTSEHSFADHLRADERVTDALPEEQLDSLLDPAEYVGLSASIAKSAITD